MSKVIRSLLVAVVFSTVLLPHPVLSQTVNPANGNTYFRTLDYVFHSDARDLANLVNGYLVSVTDEAEQEWLDASFPFGTYWLGLSDEITEGVFLWDSGEPVAYENWATGQPDDTGPGPGAADFAVVDSSLAWRDQSNFLSERAIVETPDPLLPRPAEFQCERMGLSVLLEWVPEASWEVIRLFRNGVEVAALPPGASQFEDAPGPGFHTYLLYAEAGGVRTVPAHCRVCAADPTWVLSVDDVTVPEDGTAIGRGSMDSSEELAGWSYGLCHESAILDVLDVEPGADLAAVGGGTGPSFFGAGTTAEGFSIGVVIDFFASDVFPVGNDLEIHLATYAALGPVLAASELRYCEEIGQPRVTITVVTGPTSHCPATTGAIATIGRGPFIRGDCNGDQSLGIADVLFLGTRLFSPEDEYPCREACDVNDDAVLTIADMIVELLFLFSSGAPPPAPFPGCGFDPDPAPGFPCLAPSCL